MSKKQTRKSYSREFKLDVIQQSYQLENIRELATELNLAPALIYKWRGLMVAIGPKHYSEKALKN